MHQQINKKPYAWCPVFIVILTGNMPMTLPEMGLIRLVRPLKNIYSISDSREILETKLKSSSILRSALWWTALSNAVFVKCLSKVKKLSMKRNWTLQFIIHVFVKCRSNTAGFSWTVQQTKRYWNCKLSPSGPKLNIDHTKQNFPVIENCGCVQGYQHLNTVTKDVEIFVEIQTKYL